jgi:hypothetical protein
MMREIGPRASAGESPWGESPMRRNGVQRQAHARRGPSDDVELSDLPLGSHTRRLHPEPAPEKWTRLAAPTKGWDRHGCGAMTDARVYVPVRGERAGWADTVRGGGAPARGVWFDRALTFFLEVGYGQISGLLRSLRMLDDIGDFLLKQP